MRSAVEAWRAALVDLSGGSSLADVDLLGDAVVDLTGAHPSGVAQLFAGRPTRLSNIFREVGGALPSARRRARAVAARSQEFGQRYGVPATYLAIGVATWESVDTLVEDDDVVALARVTRGAGRRTSDGGAIVTLEHQGDASVDADDPGHEVATRVAPPTDAPDAPDVATDAPAEDAGTAVGPRTVRAPVLLRPITVTPLGDGETDYELVLEPTVEINPLLARTLRAHGALLDPVALARSTFTAYGFEPEDALGRLADLGDAVLEGFELGRRLLVGAFVHPGQALVEDLDELAVSLGRHEVVAAVAGSAEATRSTLQPVRAAATGDVDPTAERGAGDLDQSQRHVLDALAAGGHLFVDAPAGSDVAGTVAAVVAEAAASGRSVLYVPGHRRSADALLARLRTLGLDDLVLDVPATPTWRTDVANRLLAAMASAPEQGRTPEAEQDLDALLGARSRLTAYIDALHLRREPWGVSAYDALQALARLTSERDAPATQVRLEPAVVHSISGERRAELAGRLERAAELGAFDDAARTTPWAGADLTTEVAAGNALLRVTRLVDQTLPQLRAQVAEVSRTTGLDTAPTVRTWSTQLTMLAGMRGTLDVFLPEVFERAADDLVNATATRQWRADHGVELSWAQRRRLRKQAKDMLRPGVRVPDLHAALVQVAEQRTVWRRHCPRGGWPVLPTGLASIEDTAEAVRIDLEDLAPVLAGTAGFATDPLDLPLEELGERLAALAADEAALTTLPHRTATLRSLHDAGLGALVDDLGARRVGKDMVGVELELAWWSSVFEQILGQDRALAGQDSTGLDALAGRFRELDRRHVEALAGPVRAAVRSHLGEAMREHREEAEQLFTELIEGRLVSVRETVERYPRVVRRLRPVTVSTPTLVPHLAPTTRTVDLLVLDAPQHTPVEQLIPALARARQVVVVADPRTASGSAVAELSDVLPTVRLDPAPSRRDLGLTRFLIQHGYEGVMAPAPVPRPDALLHRDLVDGRGMPDPRTGTVESTQAEVDRVVEVTIEHALTRPDESYAIVAGTAAHAERIREALLGEVRRNPALAPFFAGSRPEPVVVAELPDTAGLERDTVVLSLGLGRTPHGRVLHRFGVVSEAGGDAVLLAALTAARRRLRLVTCFEGSDLDPERLRGKGPQLLREVLDLAAARDGLADQLEIGNGVDTAVGPDRLVVDLAERLWRAGLVVETDYGVDDGQRVPLVVGHPDVPGELLVAVLTDDAAYVAEPSVRVRDRQVAERLERLGWSVVQVWSAAAFLDPVKEAERVRRAVEAARDARVPGRRGMPTTPAAADVPAVIDDTAVDDTAVDEASVDPRPADAPLVDSTPVGTAPVDGFEADGEVVENAVVDAHPAEDAVVGGATDEAPAADGVTVEASGVEASGVEASGVERPADGTDVEVQA
ncbi:hypothetical protein CLV28_1961 [Sediminihabitans luteus]|uniref:Restriction endonuclease type II-like domain-containing protein n=1 Tax=Sediminihabitans luteus TaxID=1138585 RepID=A0A2M9CE09_9CELL|nr:hypothetical protein CLV28_1961 [Sediminihabitans luteus]